MYMHTYVYIHTYVDVAQLSELWQQCSTCMVSPGKWIRPVAQYVGMKHRLSDQDSMLFLKLADS